MKQTAAILFFLCSLWANSALPEFSYYKLISFNPAVIDGVSNHLNFPVLIRHTDPDLKHTTFGGHVENLNGFDIAFEFNDSDTALYHEMESYNPATGEICFWVCLPYLSPLSSTTIKMYYGNSLIDMNTSTSLTWKEDYKAVYHFNGSYDDATANGFNLTNYGAVEEPSTAIGKGIYLSGGNYLRTDTLDELHLKGDFTLSAWVNTGILNVGSRQNTLLGCGGNGTGPGANFHYYFSVNDDGTLEMQWEYGSGSDVIETSTVSGVSVDETFLLTVVKDTTADEILFYVNGNQLGLSMAYSNNANSGGDAFLQIGTDQKLGSPGTLTNAWMDEVRIGANNFPQSWIKTYYNNVIDPPNFYSYGAEEVLCNVITNFNSPDSLCSDLGTINLGSFKTDSTTQGGIWSLNNEIIDSLTNISELSGQYYLQYTYNDGICSDSTKDSLFIINLVAQAGEDQEINAILSTTLGAETPILGVGNWVENNSYSITDPSNSMSLVTFGETGTFNLVWEVAYSGCLSVKDSVLIQVNPLLIPQIITPNADQKNDVLIIDGIENFDHEIIIVNRWGQVVFQSNNYSNDWGGTNLDGADLPSDTYFITVVLDGILSKSFIEISR